MKKHGWIIIVLAGMVLACLVIAAAPSLRERVLFFADELRAKVFYTLFPPQEAVFKPGGALTPGATQPVEPAPTQTVIFTPTEEPITTTPTAIPPTPTALPEAFSIPNVTWQSQNGIGRWNYCAPANLYMALTFWGWEGTVFDVGDTMKPNQDDKNVMPYEMADYVAEHTGLSAIIRYVGSLELIKNLVANGYPVLIEKGTHILETATNRMGWMGHYNLITGYDDAAQKFIVQDSYFGANEEYTYDVIKSEWRAFDYTFIIIYPGDRQDTLFTLLGVYADEENSTRIAAETASNETVSLVGLDQFFAWFNRGSALVRLQDYAGGSAAYDEAFRLYEALPEEERPWRVMWYQTGPYFAYYYMGRYQDVIALADTTISSALEPFLEETWFWRGRAKAALGDLNGAQEDLCQSLAYHPDFPPAVEVVQSLGIICP